MLHVILVVSYVVSLTPFLTFAANVTQKTPLVFTGQAKNLQSISQKKVNDELASFDGTHIVKDGDTLFGIARIYGVTYSNLIEKNTINADGSIRVGQKINVPRASLGSVSVQNLAKNEQQAIATVPIKSIPISGLHVVAYSETIFGIARSYGISPIDFATENEFELSHIIKIGDKLKIPKKNDSVIQQMPQVVPSVSSEKKVEVKQVSDIKKPTEITKTQASQSGKMCELELSWPASSRKILKSYGEILKSGAKNDGVIIESALGRAVTSAYAGEVVYAGNDIAEYGNLMIVKHKDNWMTIYGYMKSFSKKVGDRVIKGDEIGKTGDSGEAINPSLYFSIRKVKTPYNPEVCI